MRCGCGIKSARKILSFAFASRYDILKDTKQNNKKILHRRKVQTSVHRWIDILSRHRFVLTPAVGVLIYHAERKGRMEIQNIIGHCETRASVANSRNRSVVWKGIPLEARFIIRNEERVDLGTDFSVPEECKGNMRRMYQFALSILVSFVIADWNNGFALNARLANLFTPFYDQHTQTYVSSWTRIVSC